MSPDGDDENDGSENMPLKTINKAKEKVKADYKPRHDRRY